MIRCWSWLDVGLSRLLVTTTAPTPPSSIFRVQAVRLGTWEGLSGHATPRAAFRRPGQKSRKARLERVAACGLEATGAVLRAGAL